MIGRFKQWYLSIREYLDKGMWEPDSGGRFKRFWLDALRVTVKTLTGFSKHRCALHAAGLTYFTMLAVVPVVCLLLLLARTCGLDDFARNKINATIDSMIVNVEKGPDDLPEFLTKNQTPEQIEAKRMAARDFAVQAREMSNGLFDKIDGLNVKAMGWVGVLMLLWTVVSTFGRVEVSFNELWEVERQRPLWKRFVLYAFVALVLPLLIALAMSMPVLHVVRRALDATLGATSYTKWVGDALMALLDSRIFGLCFTLVFASMAYAFVLWFMPNRIVRFRAAFAGGMFTAILSGCWLKLCAVAQVGIAKSSALYGSFAFLPIVLAWVYMSWQIMLFGGSLAYAIEHVHGRHGGNAGDGAG